MTDSKQLANRHFLPISFPFSSLLDSISSKTYLCTLSFDSSNMISLYLNDYLICEVDGVFPFGSGLTTIVVGAISTHDTSYAVSRKMGIVMGSVWLLADSLQHSLLSKLSYEGPFHSLQWTSAMAVVDLSSSQRGTVYLTTFCEGEVLTRPLTTQPDAFVESTSSLPLL